jgi:hypothetical protein
MPPGATATLTPSTIPAGSGATTVTLAIQTIATTARLDSGSPLIDRALSPVSFALILLPFAGLFRRSLRRRLPSPRARNLLGALLLVLACGAALAGLSGCGSNNSGYLAQRSQTFTVTVTATSGTLSHATSVILTVN